MDNEIIKKYTEAYNDRRILILNMDEEMNIIREKYKPLLEPREQTLRDLEKILIEEARSSPEAHTQFGPVVVSRRSGRRFICAKPHEVPDDLKALLTKTQVTMVSIAEFDRIVKDNGHIPADVLRDAVKMGKDDDTYSVGLKE